MKRVLITGVEGFTGRYVAAEMAAHGWEVWGAGLRHVAGDPHYRQVDLVDEHGLREIVDQVRPDTVIHLAAIAYVGHGDAEQFYRTNLIGTRNLLSALASQQTTPGCVLLASSANVYGNSLGGLLSEQAPLNPMNDYAVSKLAMEYMSRLWFDELPIVLVRPFNYTGVGQAENFLLPKIVSHFRRKAEFIELGNLDVSRDFSDVRAVSQAYRRLLEVRPQSDIVNVASGRIHSLREVIAMAESITGQRIRVRVNPAFVRSNEVKALAGDPARLKSLIGDWDTPPLEETLRWMLREPR